MSSYCCSIRLLIFYSSLPLQKSLKKIELIIQKKKKRLNFYLQPQFILELLVSITDGDLCDIGHI